MPYVTRDEDGRLVGLSEVPLDEDAEELPIGAPEVDAFLHRIGGVEAVGGDPFVEVDLDFIRVLEDLLEVLMGSGILKFTDLPEAARVKLRERRAMRHWLAAGRDQQG
jgi:hypothetical protein